jgi:hypothetical protein
MHDVIENKVMQRMDHCCIVVMMVMEMTALRHWGEFPSRRFELRSLDHKVWPASTGKTRWDSCH